MKRARDPDTKIKKKMKKILKLVVKDLADSRRNRQTEVLVRGKIKHSEKD